MNLNNFEDFIDLNIIEKGREYYENDFVISLQKLKANTFKVEVQGTNIYKVLITVNEDSDLLSAECNCAYEGTYCKHIIASFYEIRDMLNGVLKHYKNEKLAANIKIDDDVKLILAQRSKDELLQFIISLANQYDELKQQILLKFFSGTEGEELRLCRELIDTYIRQNSDRDGFVTYHQSFEAVKGARIVLNRAKEGFLKNIYCHSVEIVICVIHEIMKLLQFSDDSGGVVSGILHESFDLIDDIIMDDHNINSSEKQKVFYKLLEESSNKRYSDWIEYRLNLMEDCVYLADTPDLRSLLEDKLISLLENSEDMILDRTHLEERVKLIVYNMIEKYEDKKTYDDFIQANLEYPAFRKLAINNALKNKDYELVIKLALEGEKQHEKLIRLKREWKGFRYDAYKQSMQLENQRKLAVDFIVDGNFEYYTELKSTYAIEEWKSIYPSIIKSIEDKERTFISSYSSILVEECEFKKLLDYVKQNPSSLILYYNYLIPEFKNEVYEIFKDYILETASKATSRKDYHVVCSIIKKLSNAGGEDTANDIINMLLPKYNHKPTFKDELQKIQLY
jgi:hypothetical protein